MKRAAMAAVFFTAVAAHATTLGELLKAAESNNVDRQISLEQRHRAATELEAAWWSLAPSLTAQGSYTYNQYEALIPKIVIDPTADPREKVALVPHNQLSGLLRFEVPLIDTTRWFRTSALAAADEGAGYRDQLVHDAVVRQVSTTYYAYAAAVAVRESTKRSLATAEEQFKLQDVRYKAGAVTELEVLRARAEVERNKQTLSDSESLVANTQRALKTLTGIDVAEEIALPVDNLQTEGELAQLEQRTSDVPAVLAAQS
ncbi:MAG: TolC family protein, partial [Myxococcaceae bacterium]